MKSVEKGNPVSVQQSHYSAFKRAFELIDQITVFLDQDLRLIRSSIHDAAEQLMVAAKEMAVISENRRKDAEQMMLDTHLNPDAEVSQSIEAAQKDVDDLVDAALDGQDLNENDEKVVQRREGSKFSKNVEAISKYEEALTKILIELAGALSTEDVVSQILDNVIVNHQDLSTFFRLFPNKHEHSAPIKDIKAIMEAILTGTQKRLISTEEKKLLTSHMAQYSFYSNSTEVSEFSDITQILEFVKRYESFLASQISVLKQGYSQIIEDAMNVIYQINDSSTTYKAHAKSVMMRTEGDKFANKVVEEEESPEEQAKRRSELFTLPKELLKGLDDNISQHMLTMMGCLSVGDVVAQKLYNVEVVHQAVLKMVCYFQEQPELRLHPQKVDRIQQDCLSHIARTFVSVEEKAEFEKVFGDIKQYQKAS